MFAGRKVKVNTGTGGRTGMHFLSQLILREGSGNNQYCCSAASQLRQGCGLSGIGTPCVLYSSYTIAIKLLSCGGLCGVLIRLEIASLIDS